MFSTLKQKIFILIMIQFALMSQSNSKYTWQSERKGEVQRIKQNVCI